MSGLDWGLLASVVALVLVSVTLWFRVRSLSDRLDATCAALDELSRRTMPLLADTRSALRKADGVNRKTDALLDVATSLTATADSASRLAYKLVSNPLVKVIAFFTGTGRAAKRLAEITAPNRRLDRRLEPSSTGPRALRRSGSAPKALPRAPSNSVSGAERHARFRRNRSK